MTRVHVAVGSNIDPHVHVPSALDALDGSARIIASSRFYETAPIDRPEQDPYWNGIVVVETRHPPDEFRDMLHGIEADEGRVRSEDKWAAREIDLDVLLVDGHPVPGAGEEVARRAFLRWALADLSGEADPGAGQVVRGPWPFS